MKKLIIYELNELPKRLLDDYIALKPNSTLASILKKGSFNKTITSDCGELHPWSTWPTFYRGVDNSKHQLKFINQDKYLANSSYPAVWDILSRNNISIGIFGSLQSYPPPKISKNVKFYLPDTFAPDEKSFPKKLEIFQKFNLSLVSNNKAISRNIRIKDLKYFFICLLNNIIGIKTLITIISQVIKEKFFKKYKLRRSLLQPIIGFNTYFEYLKKEKPSFSTFFTNHLAGMMHRYWYDYFPEDFEIPPRIKSDFKKKSIINALDIVDTQLKVLLKFAKKNNYNIWIASSMGQDFIKREIHTKKLYLEEPKSFLRILDLDSSNYIFLPSMYPDINIDCKDAASMKKIISKVKELVDSNNEQIIKLRYKPVQERINLIINRSKSVIEDEYLIFKNKKLSLSMLGLKIFKMDQGTGYHIPEGILLTYGEKSKNLLGKLDIIDTKKVAPLILNFFNLDKESYMQNI